jgi:hypothetical protein
VRRAALLLCAALLAVGSAGCGGSHRTTASTTAAKLPRSLAQAWATRADAIAAAASAGHGCVAQTLADSLREDVVTADARVPAAYRTTLLVSVNQLADRITCVPQTTTAAGPAHNPPKPPQHDEHQKPPKNDHQKEH